MKKMNKNVVLAAALVVATPMVAMAAVDPFSAPLSSVQGLFNGSAASLLALIALIAGILLSIGGRMTAAYASFALALIIGVGDTIATGLAGL